MVLLASVSSVFLGLSGWPLVFLVFAVASGQASVGWSNDYLDAHIDKTLERASKPSVRDGLNPSSLRLPILVSLILVIPFSFLAGGFIGGLAHLVAVGSAWAYNLWLARTVWSWIPYAVSFALLTVFIAQAVSRDFWPSWPIVCLAILVGIVAHLLNAIPDIEIDRQSHLGGLAVRLGRTISIRITLLLLAACLVFLAISIASMS